jgi:hypothetical protein
MTLHILRICLDKQYLRRAEALPQGNEGTMEIKWGKFQ